MNRLLLIVDPQIDFIEGSLPVPGAAEAMDRLAEYVASHAENYAAFAVTGDYHPADHCSFRENGGQWPVHCLEGTHGASIWPPLLDALHATGRPLEILQKGTASGQEEYSIFKNPLSAGRLRDTFAQRHIDHVDVCGLAGDICVLNTLEDGIKLHGRKMFHVLRQFSPSLDGGKALASFLQEAE